MLTIIKCYLSVENNIFIYIFLYNNKIEILFSRDKYIYTYILCIT